MSDEVRKIANPQPAEEPARYLTDHAIDPLNKGLAIRVTGPRTVGNAQVSYEIMRQGEDGTELLAELCFQPKPLSETGGAPVGITNEALIAICIDRLRSFQAGEHPCRENALSITKLEEALHWQQARTRDRIERGVEGKAVK